MQTDAVESLCQIDPTGRWIPYAARQGELSEVYVDSFPTPGAKRHVSVGGAGEPRWRADGKELYFLAGDTLMAASLRITATSVVSDTPRALFEAPVFAQGGPAGRRRYDVTDGGSQFLFIVPAERSEAALTVVTNWPATLAR